MKPRSNDFEVRTQSWPFQPARSLGQMIRDARDHGVMPEMDTVQAAFDDDKEVGVDPFANPCTDRMDLMDAGLVKEAAAMAASAVPNAEPAAVPNAEPAADPNASQTPQKDPQTE